ncbi:glycosyltransferase, MSMEG_0565 family [Asanoa hainanensis]|uniref:Glycosyltransferase, MSMEG_0565 family n=1 Tax=Asanoa hainanensis TaxID=560556 RepID=A0A239GPB9_9ACTN|nr:MSMEG_0565 family glycosyltransferase [Asanoa hainanensis]SNS70980.1 glycosyltransferase, MSMEG_0565 family [Asanoa hainanensis]
MRVGLLTYSTRPRGGVVHTLAVAEALAAAGVDVHVFGLGTPGEQFFRPTTVPFTLFPAPTDTTSLEEKVFASIDSLTTGLAAVADRFDVLHSQDCISARAAARVRDAGAAVTVVRTVHHVDDFTTQALIDCQRKAIVEPDHVLVVSDYWRRQLHEEYGITARIVRNGVDPARFLPIEPQRAAALRATLGADDRFVFLTVGGVEPRKGTKTLFEALDILRDRGRHPVLAVIGGHSFRDYGQYEREAMGMVSALGIDVVRLGTLADEEVAAWYRGADALAFPSLNEGFGLAVLEALAADLPVVASRLPVFREFLVDERDALLPTPGDPYALADALERVMTDATLRKTLVEGGRAVVPSFTWAASAARHVAIYQSL